MVVYEESHLIKTWSCDNRNNMTKQRVCGVGHFQQQKERGGLCARLFGGNSLGSSPVSPPTATFTLHWLA